MLAQGIHRRAWSRPRRGSLCAWLVASIGVAAIWLRGRSSADFTGSHAGARPPRAARETPAPAHEPSRAVLRAAAEAGAESSAARERFLELLEKKDGDWRDEEVKAELEILQAANPTPDPALSGEYLDAEWLQISRPDFNYGNEGSTTYSLGQLSFNMYEPKDMKFRIDRLVQDVAPVTEGDGTRTWDVSMELTCEDERYPPFQAKMTTFGRVSPSKDEKETQRLEVWFTGGELKPAAGTSPDMQKKWMEVFSDSFKNKKWSLGGAFQNWMMGMMMGLRPPDSVQEDGKIIFEMKKPPHGYTDVLYIDDKLRVTKGNRGSVVVTTRG